MNTDATRQSNRVTGTPLANFRSGVTNLPALKSQSYPGLLLVLLVLLGSRSKYLPVDVTRGVQCATVGLYLC